MSLEQCYIDWLDALTLPQRLQVQESLNDILITPFEQLQNAINIFNDQVAEVQSVLDAAQARIDSIDQIAGLLPTPGFCPQLDDDFTDLLSSVKDSLTADVTKLSGRVSAMQSQVTGYQNEVTDIQNKAASADSLKFW